MFFCLRVDLDYVPWDTPDAQEFGHGEPATFLRLLDLSRGLGLRLHFFASNRVLRAFSSTAEAVLNEGHDLDWLCKHPEVGPERREELNQLFLALGHSAQGLAVSGVWPNGAHPGVTEGLRFISAHAGSAPPAGLKMYPVESRTLRDASRHGVSARAWTDSLKGQIRDYASRNKGLTVVVRPQVLGKYDSKLSHLKEVLELTLAIGMEVKTLRQLERGD